MLRKYLPTDPNTDGPQMTTALTTAVFAILLPLSEGQQVNERSLDAPTPPAADLVEAKGTAGIHSATRMRKLHLVRPDLIPYPLAYDIYC